MLNHESLALASKVEQCTSPVAHAIHPLQRRQWLSQRPAAKRPKKARQESQTRWMQLVVQRPGVPGRLPAPAATAQLLHLTMLTCCRCCRAKFAKKSLQLLEHREDLLHMLTLLLLLLKLDCPQRLRQPRRMQNARSQLQRGPQTACAEPQSSESRTSKIRVTASNLSGLGLGVSRQEVWEV